MAGEGAGAGAVGEESDTATFGLVVEGAEVGGIAVVVAVVVSGGGVCSCGWCCGGGEGSLANLDGCRKGRDWTKERTL